MRTNIGESIKRVEQKHFKKDVPDFEVGDTVKMMVRVKEQDKERLHPFEGIVIKKTGRGLRASFTVRKISFGEGVERAFPLHSPVIEKFKVISRGIVSKSKLYYLRDRLGKGARVRREPTQ